MPLWVPPVAIGAIAAAVIICLFFLNVFRTGHRERAKPNREAGVKFRSAFAVAIALLDRTDAPTLMSQAKGQHDAAIIEFRPFVDPKQVKHFDAAEQKFRRCRSELQPSALKPLESKRLGKPVDNSDIVKLKEAINELLTFADKT